MPVSSAFRLAAPAACVRAPSSRRALSSTLQRPANGRGGGSSAAAGRLALRATLARRAARHISIIAASSQQPPPPPPLVRSGSGSVAAAELDLTAPFLEPLARSLVLGVGTGVLLETAHLAAQVLTGSFPGVWSFQPLLVADHVIGLAAFVCLYALDAAAVTNVLKRFNFDRAAASQDLSRLVTLPKRMLPGRMLTFKRFLAAGSRLLSSRSRTTSAAAATSAAASISPEPSYTTTSAFVTDQQPTAGAATPSAPPTAEPRTLHPPTRARGGNSVVPAPPGLTGRGKQAGGGPALEPPPTSVAKRTKELRDREAYLKNMWYAAALSSNLKDKPVKTVLCGREMVLFRDEQGKARCIDNTCPHRGAPLSSGWVEHGKGEGKGHSCVVCPYHGWALDGEGSLRDVPATENKGEWAKRPLVDSWPVEEKGGFVWVFYGSKALPAEERPPVPYVPELDDREWRAVYEEIEFDCGHFGVFENAIDMAHIHYLHGDSFGNQDKPEIRGMTAFQEDPFSVTAKFTIHNKPVNAFWALFQVPEVHVTARAFLPSTSLVTFELGGGLHFTTFVNTVPISATKSINRFALVRKLSSDKTGIFLSPVWDVMARNAMLKIQKEDKEMVEMLRYDQLEAESNVRADLPQIMFRKLRQQYVDLGYAVPTEREVAPFASSPARDRTGGSC